MAEMMDLMSELAYSGLIERVENHREAYLAVLPHLPMPNQVPAPCRCGHEVWRECPVIQQAAEYLFGRTL